MELVRTKKPCLFKAQPLEDTEDIKSLRDVLMTKILENPVAYLQQTGMSLFEFIQVFWNEASEDTFQPNWHIELLCKELEALAYQVGDQKPKLHDLLINIPPGTTKTITCSIMFPVWCWTRWHWMRFITCSYSGTLALESALKSRDIIRSDKFKTLYPELGIKEDSDIKSNYRIYKEEQVYEGQRPRINYGGNRYSTSVGGTLTGFHGHIIIVDDPLNPSQAASEIELQKANYWIERTLSTRKTDKRVTPTVLVMQRLHQNDPSGYLLAKKKKNIKHICLPGEIREYREQLQPPELAKFYKNDLLDAVRINWDVLRELETDLGQYGYAGQIGQNPVPPGGGMFKVDNFFVFESIPSSNPIVHEVRYWDKAGTADGGAYTVGVKMARLRDGKFIVTDVKRGQWAAEKREIIIKNTAEMDGRNCLVGLEQEPGSGGKESAEATVRNLAGFRVEVERPTGDKVFRADPYSVQVNYGNVYILRGEWNKAFIEEYRFFPFGTYKDQVDAGSGAFNRLVNKKIARRLV